MELLYSFLWGYLVYLILFSVYVELSPGLTNIWYRIGSDGNKHVNLSSYLHFLASPFMYIDFWYPMNWDLNYFIGATITSGLFYYLL
jgi:hypothetical protein